MSAAQTLRQAIAPWQWANNEHSRLGRWLHAAFWLTLLLLPAAAAVRWLPTAPAAIALVLWLVMALVTLWALQFDALLRLDHPSLARLVPMHAARLRSTALALWAACTAAGGGLVAVCLVWLPPAAGWPAGPELLTLTLPAAGALLVAVALAMRWLWLWGLVALFPLLGSQTIEWARLAQPHWQARPWLTGAVLLVAMALALAALFGRGDAAHARIWARRERWRRITQAGLVGQKPTLAAYGRWGEWLGAPWQRLADAWLAHTTRHAQPTAASAMTRAEIVLHGAQHWVRHLGVLVPLLAGLVTLFAVAVWRLEPGVAARVFENGHVGMGVGLLSMVLGTVLSLPGALWASRREQALLMLLPGMPRGAALNRALAWRQARHFLMLWALTLPAYLGLAWAGQVPQVLALPAVVLTAMAWLGRNAARQREPSALGAVLPFVLCLVPGIASIALLRERPELAGPLLAGLAIVAAVLLPWRWRQLSRWPQALPAGRWR